MEIGSSQSNQHAQQCILLRIELGSVFIAQYFVVAQEQQNARNEFRQYVKLHTLLVVPTAFFSGTG
jgi:hypothetical protein